MAGWTPHTTSAQTRNAPGKIQREIWHRLKYTWKEELLFSWFQSPSMPSVNASSLLFWCAVSLHFWKWTTAISVLFPIYLGGTSCSHCFWKTFGKMFFGFHGVTCLQREVNLLRHDKRALKSSPSSCESESEEKEESETLKNTSRFIKCHGEPYGALITCVSYCKSLMQCVHARSCQVFFHW